MLNWRLCIGLALISGSATAAGTSGAMQVSASVVLVQCTAEQQQKFRACAKSEQHTSVAPYKTMVTIESRPGQREAVGPRQEILVDGSRKVIINTLLYY